MNYTHPSQIMDEIARLTPTFTAQASRASTNWAASSGRATRNIPVLRKNSIQGFRLDLAIRCCGMIVV